MRGVRDPRDTASRHATTPSPADATTQQPGTALGQAWLCARLLLPTLLGSQEETEEETGAGTLLSSRNQCWPTLKQSSLLTSTEAASNAVSMGPVNTGLSKESTVAIPDQRSGINKSCILCTYFSQNSPRKGNKFIKHDFTKDLPISCRGLGKSKFTVVHTENTNGE